MNLKWVFISKEIILSILLDGDSYEYEIIKTIVEKSGGEYELKEPSLYTSLKRLEKDKLKGANNMNQLDKILLNNEVGEINEKEK